MAVNIKGKEGKKHPNMNTNQPDVQRHEKSATI